MHISSRILINKISLKYVEVIVCFIKAMLFSISLMHKSFNASYFLIFTIKSTCTLGTISNIPTMHNIKERIKCINAVE